MSATRRVDEVLFPGWNRVALATFTEVVSPIDTYRSLGHMVESLLDEPSEAAVIAELGAELAATGRFRSPLRVCSGVLDNGCHRYAAALLANVDSVDVWVVDADHPDPAWTRDRELVDLTYRLDSAQLDADGIDDVFFSTRSFPLDADTWAESDGAARCRDEYTVAFYVAHTSAAALDIEFRRRLAASGVTATLVATELGFVES